MSASHTQTALKILWPVCNHLHPPNTVLGLRSMDAQALQYYALMLPSVSKKVRELPMIFRTSLEKAKDGWIVAQCPALPGRVSQGRDEKEALENKKEAITAWLWAKDQKAVNALGSDSTPVVVAV
jgi:predicted RNase H-like HicB family nuclease